jgi:hypothetical protein
MKLYLFKIKEGKLETWLAWGKLLMTKYSKEATETLKEEGLSYESFCYFNIGGSFYTLAMIDGHQHPTNMDRDLNIKHREIKRDCLERIDLPAFVYELYNK